MSAARLPIDGQRPPLQKIVLGTRGSELAGAQTEMVRQALSAARQELAIEIKVIKTSGDEGGRTPAALIDRRAGRKGMFTAEIERALLAREIDIAVHSAKDLPSESATGAEIGAVLARGPVDDVLISKKSKGFEALPHTALVATGSVRRAHQLRAQRADLRIVEVRGNVPTRLQKLMENDWDALVLARAGLERLGFQPMQSNVEFKGSELFADVLATRDFLPAGGQGVIALQIRSDDIKTKQLVACVNHQETFLCLRAEREFLRLLDGDCDSPVAALATVEASVMRLCAEVFEPESQTRRSGHAVGNPNEPEALASKLIRQMDGR